MYLHFNRKRVFAFSINNVLPQYLALCEHVITVTITISITTTTTSITIVTTLITLTNSFCSEDYTHIYSSYFIQI